MKTTQLIRAFLIVELMTPQAFSQSSAGCEMSGVSGLWPDGSGSWSGSSTIEWKSCSDGNSYVASCLHQGSGATMSSCLCRINEEAGAEQSCDGRITSDDLTEASRQCCGYFKPDSPAQNSEGALYFW